MQDEDAKDEPKTREGDKPRICKKPPKSKWRTVKKQRGRGVFCVVGVKGGVHPGRLTWNIIMEVWKIIFLSKWVFCR